MSRFKLLSLALLVATAPTFAQTYTVLHNFGQELLIDPAGPLFSGIIAQSRGGAMVTTSGNTDSSEPGTAFRIWPTGSVEVLNQYGFFNSNPWGGLVLARDGKFYGTTKTGGAAGFGTVFKMKQDGSVTTLYEFQGGSDGAYPDVAPIQSEEGDLYGTTTGADFGNPPYGSVFRITTDGNFTLLHTFNGSDGAYPRGPLVQGTDYFFYGVTESGGAGGHGTIFRISRSGDFKVMVNFDGAGGDSPFSGLIEANDGNFYGVTANGGSSGAGVLFRMTPHGSLTVLHSFTGGNDGKNVLGGLVQASDGNLYGTNTQGGKNGYGIMFRATLAGAVVPLHDFGPAAGEWPYSPVLQHTNGRLYGSTAFGGKFGSGVFYSLDAGLPPFVRYLPTYGRVGALVQILGQGFTADSKVTFEGAAATSPVIVSPTYLQVEVPPGATTGPITVTTSSGTLTSNKVLIIHPN